MFSIQSLIYVEFVLLYTC